MTAKHRLQSICQACGVVTEIDYPKPSPNMGKNVCSNCLQIAIAVLEHMSVVVMETQMPDKEVADVAFGCSATHLTACLKAQQQSAANLNARSYYQS